MIHATTTFYDASTTVSVYNSFNGDLVFGTALVLSVLSFMATGLVFSSFLPNPR